MSTASALQDLESRIRSRYALLFLDSWEEERWEKELEGLASRMKREFVVWTATAGARPRAELDVDTTQPLEFLKQIPGYAARAVFLLKDFGPYLRDPRVVRGVRDLLPTLSKSGQTLLFLGPEQQLPLELQKESVRISLPLPTAAELGEELAALRTALASNGKKQPLQMTPDEEERVVKAVLGLTGRQARQALTKSLAGRTAVDDEVFAMLVSEKKRMVQGSELLEFHELAEGLEDVGGLEALKEWIRQRSRAFSNEAREKGVPMPKGVLLLGVQGCGKSLTSRAVARILSFPLVRLDVSNLLSSDFGTSEKHMRDVLSLLETISPAVLWLDEIEKGFSGGSDEGRVDPTMTRLAGRFLTWMQEHTTPVFVVATANSVSGLPPEMLRRGRFDELFFIDLPNYHERKQILNIHLQKRGWNPAEFEVGSLAAHTEGFSGAELEQIVSTAMIETFARGTELSQEELVNARNDTVPLSVTMEERIFALREWARTRCRRATPDSRVMQMIEAEEGHITADIGADIPAAAFDSLPDLRPEWLELAEHGNVTEALVKYVQLHHRVSFSELQEDFGACLETSGDQVLALRADTNVVLWLGFSRELAEPLTRLLGEQRLFIEPAGADDYTQNGLPRDLPILREVPENRLSRPAWLPSCLSAEAGDTDPLGRVTRLRMSGK